MKLVKQEEAKLLRKRGKSIKEISLLLGVSKSSVSIWVRNVILSEKAKIILQRKYTNAQIRASEALHKRTRKRLDEAKDLAVKTLENFSDTIEVHQVCCALLYWCEGTKTVADKELKFTNSDPEIIATFLKLLRDSFKIEEKKFRVGVHLHSYHDEKKQLQFWSKITRIPLSQFIKPYKKPHTGKQKREGYQGCIQVSYNDVLVARYVQAIARMFVGKYGPIV